MARGFDWERPLSISVPNLTTFLQTGCHRLPLQGKHFSYKNNRGYAPLVNLLRLAPKNTNRNVRYPVSKLKYALERTAWGQRAEMSHWLGSASAHTALGHFLIYSLRIAVQTSHSFSHIKYKSGGEKTIHPAAIGYVFAISHSSDLCFVLFSINNKLVNKQTQRLYFCSEMFVNISSGNALSMLHFQCASAAEPTGAVTVD